MKMEKRNFRKMLEKRWDLGFFVCVGLDTDYKKIPDWFKEKYSSVKEAIWSYNREIIDTTHDLVCAYKPNIAFYEGQGVEGLLALENTIDSIKTHAPGVPIILDFKRADIGNTNKGYVQAAFEEYKVDAVTVHPYLGKEALQPFLDRVDKGIIVLVRTSNPGAGEFQDLQVNSGPLSGAKPLYQIVAQRVAEYWNENNNCAVVVGATYPDELREIRQIVGDLPILIPGIGAQGGDVEATVKAGKDSQSKGMIINSSRGIIFASKEADFAEAARRETVKLTKMINQYR
jgi:orotidine-5'-phosphate decarboxylase